MTEQANASMAVAVEARRERFDRVRLARAVAILLGLVVAADQAGKWWAGRHVLTIVNPGATGFLGPVVSGWYADPWRGQVLDALSGTALAVALTVLIRRPRCRLVLVSASLTIGGWGSNLLDRLGLHALTYPGSERGAVDYIRFGRYLYNLADVLILVGALLGLATSLRWLHRRATARRQVPVHPWAWLRLAGPAVALAGVGALTVACGALHPPPQWPPQAWNGPAPTRCGPVNPWFDEPDGAATGGAGPLPAACVTATASIS
jgi:lipoprotein signal peptidase